MTRKAYISKPKQQGLTLIEVMLAVVILGIGLVVLIASASRCIAVVKTACLYEDARHLLALIDLEHPLQRDEIEEGSEEGTFSGSYSDYRWKREIKMVGEEEEGLYSLSKQVFWTEKGKRASEEVIMYIYAPSDDL
ncbi:MAG: prepilin-type N-terminal cleavage/methylation domain-containing protein [Kiritimatiellae bacterium]|nr:prepilin-type N-terminal cleavage/methylation domain-containing protein [Kiritimatiellia bacterium]